MKRITAILFAVIFVLSVPVISFADDIYIVEDEEDNYIPEIPTTTKPAETTTKSADSLFGDIDIDGYFGDLSGMLGEGLDSIVSGFEDAFGDFQLGDFVGNNKDEDKNQLQPIQPEIPVTVKPVVTTSADKQTDEKNQNDNSDEPTKHQQQQQAEIPSVLIVNQNGNSDDRVSGSTLTLLVFIAAIVIIIITGAIVLVIMTKRTEYNSQVKSRSTIPSVDQPDALAQFMDDGIRDDGKDYGNITYWNKE
jgi:preprotein translocase subunit SecG